jgi:hypothetical protein
MPVAYSFSGMNFVVDPKKKRKDALLLRVKQPPSLEITTDRILLFNKKMRPNNAGQLVRGGDNFYS